jgi:ATP synthase F1 delta subunit
MWSKCPYSWKLNYLEGKRIYEASLNTCFGTAIHHALQEYIKTLYTIGQVDADSINVYTLFKDKFNPVTYGIFVIITNKNREKILPAVAKEFISMYTDYKGIQTATVTTASSLTADQKATVAKIVKDYTGKEVELIEQIDESLIGGFILKVGDQQIDDSIKRKLNDLKVSLVS